MALKSQLTKEEFDALPDVIKEHYTVRDDGAVLDVTKVGSLELADVEKLQKALRDERQGRKTSEQKLKEFEDLDPQAARDAIAKLEEIGDSGGPEVEKAKEALKATLTAQFSRDREALTKKYTEEQEVLNKKNSTYREQLEQVMIESAARAAIAEHMGQAELLLPLIRQRARLNEAENGKLTVELLDDSGTPMLGSDYSTPIGMSDFVKSLRSDKRYARAFDAENSNGTGKSSGSGGSGNDHKIRQSDARDSVKFRAAEAAAQKAGVALEIVPD